MVEKRDIFNSLKTITYKSTSYHSYTRHNRLYNGDLVAFLFVRFCLDTPATLTVAWGASKPRHHQHRQWVLAFGLFLCAPCFLVLFSVILGIGVPFSFYEGRLRAALMSCMNLFVVFPLYFRVFSTDYCICFEAVWFHSTNHQSLDNIHQVKQVLGRIVKSNIMEGIFQDIWNCFND